LGFWERGAYRALWGRKREGEREREMERERERERESELFSELRVFSG